MAENKATTTGGTVARKGIVARIGGVLTSTGRYVRQVIGETRKTVTPTVREWLGWSVASGVFVLLLMALVSGMDFGLGKLTLWVFG